MYLTPGPPAHVKSWYKYSYLSPQLAATFLDVAYNSPQALYIS